ncbi:ESPR-type extended signal peptide-containing protein, partial [Acinetobacter junii]|uniref:ESPR-type extended signal peptide-containing protein n=1 Tax=Acinetobacter junii TaxID=40215 RepID=UPI002286960C
MNKVYKVVWNASLGIWVAVSELAKGKVKGSNGKVGGISTVEESNEKSHSETINLKTLSLAVITIVAPNWVYAGTEVSGTPTKSGSNITNINTCTASATTTNGVAIGCSSIAGAKDSVIADRSNPYNTSTSNSRVTFDTTSGGNTAIGTGASAGNANQGLATAIGTYATANNVAAVAIGAAALSTGNTSLSIGRQSAATADYAQAIGNVAAATGTGALAIGHSATATGYRGIAIGSPDIDNASVVAGQAGAAYQTVGQTKASGRDAIAFGGGSQSLKDEGMTIGAFSGATEQGAAVVGVRGAALGQQSLSIGNGATNVESGTNTPVSLTKSLGAGTSNNKTVGARIFTVTNSISETKGNTAGTLTGTVDGVAITITQAAGTGNSTTGTVGAITGGSYNGQTLSAEQAKALYQSLGHSGSVTLGSQSIAIGTATSALANNALALGSTSLASGNGSVAIGSGSTATKTDAVSIGRGAGSSVVSGVAIGAEAKVQGDNSIALGQKSVASAQINSSFLTNVDATTQGTISVGSETDNIKRRLTNLADGAVDSDGVTVAQLKQFKVLTDKQGSDTAAALGGGSAYNATTGAITLPTYNVGGTTQTTVAGAITNIDNRTTSLENQTWKLNTNSDTATTVGKDVEVKFSDGKNIKITRTGTNVTIATTDSAAFDSITTGNSKLDNNGLVVKDATGGVSVSKDSIKFVNADGTTQTANSPSLNKTGINAGNQKITNIADGSLALGSKEAVNGGQLTSAVDAATDTAGTTLANVLGGTASYDSTTNTWTAPTNIGGTGKNTIDEAISSVKGAAETPMTFVGNARNSGDTKDVERKLGESLTISGAATTAGSYSGKNVRTVT